MPISAKKKQLNSMKLPTFPEWISNSHRFSKIFSGVATKITEKKPTEALTNF